MVFLSGDGDEQEYVDRYILLAYARIALWPNCGRLHSRRLEQPSSPTTLHT